MPAPAYSPTQVRVDLGDGDYLFIDSEHEIPASALADIEKAARTIRATLLVNKIMVSGVEIGPNAGASSGS